MKTLKPSEVVEPGFYWARWGEEYVMSAVVEVCSANGKGTVSHPGNGRQFTLAKYDEYIGPLPSPWECYSA